MGRLSTPTVSSVPGEYNYFSAGAKVIITAGASGYCTQNLINGGIKINFTDLCLFIKYGTCIALKNNAVK